MPPAIVFAAAPLEPTPRLLSRLADLSNPFVVAADDGASTALAFGRTPDVVIGDLDSLSSSTLVRLRSASIPVEEYPRDKDATDGQLAVERALQVEPSELYLLGFVGGPRLDQALANVSLLERIEVPAVLLDAHNECVLVRPGRPYAWRPEPTEIVSLLPPGLPAEGVRTRGLRWPLHAETLRSGDTRGVSNEPIGQEASVSITGGRLLLTRFFPQV